MPRQRIFKPLDPAPTEGLQFFSGKMTTDFTRERILVATYWVMAAVLVAGTSWSVSTHPLFTYSLNNDFWEHSAIIREWMNNLWNPGNPHLKSDIGSPRYTPFYFVLAVIGKTFDFGAIDVLKIAAVLNISLLTLGIFLFFRTYFRNELAPSLGLIVLLTCWGTAWTWSSVYQLRSLLYVGPYPSTFAFAMTLVCLWYQTVMLRAIEVSLVRHIGFAILVALIFASHPFTGGFAVLTFALLAMFLPGGTLKTRAAIMVAVAVGLGLSELWPYYSVFKVTLGLSGGDAGGWIDHGKVAWDARARAFFSEHAYYRQPYVLIALGPVLAGDVCLVFLARRREHRFILFGALVMFPPYIVNLVFRIPLGHRFLIFTVFFLHLALVWAALECLRRMYTGTNAGKAPLAIKAAAGGVGMAVAAGMAFNLAYVGVDIALKTENWDPVPDNLGQIVRSVPRDGVVMARPLLAWAVPTFGGKVIALLHPNPMVPDQIERQSRVAAFFDPETLDTERTKILRNYGASHVLIDVGETPAEVLSYLSSIGALKESLGRLRLIEIRPLAS